MSAFGALQALATALMGRVASARRLPSSWVFTTIELAKPI